jgi:hypothetical protein
MGNGAKESFWDLVEELGDDCHAYEALLHEFVRFLNVVQLTDFVETYRRIHDKDLPS